MELSPQIITVHSRDFDLGGDWLCFKEDPDPALKQSLAEFGVLTPVLADFSAGRPKLLAGRKRVLAAREAKLSVPARQIFLPEGPDYPLMAGQVYLASNLGQGFGEERLLAAARYFLRHTDFAGFNKACSGLLGLKSGDKAWAWLQTWLEFPDWLDARLAAGRLTLNAAELLRGLGPEDLQALRPYLEYAGYSRNQLAGFLTPLREVALARTCALADVLAEPGFSGLLGAKLSPADFLNRLSLLAKQTRYPALCGLEERFSRQAKAANPGKLWKLAPALSFEADSLRLETVLKSPQGLDAALKELEALGKRPEFEELFKLGQGLS